MEIKCPKIRHLRSHRTSESPKIPHNKGLSQNLMHKSTHQWALFFHSSGMWILNVWKRKNLCCLFRHIPATSVTSKVFWGKSKKAKTGQNGPNPPAMKKPLHPLLKSYANIPSSMDAILKKNGKPATCKPQICQGLNSLYWGWSSNL